MECKDDEVAAGAVGGGTGKAKEKTAFQIKKGAERSNNDDEDGLGFSTHSKRKLSLGLRHVGEERNVRGRCDGGWDSKLGLVPSSGSASDVAEAKKERERCVCVRARSRTRARTHTHTQRI